MLAAMGPPGGGRNHVTHRFLRHFNLVSIDTFDEATMQSIFTPIIEWHFNNGFDVSLKRFARVCLNQSQLLKISLVTSRQNRHVYF